MKSVIGVVFSPNRNEVLLIQRRDVDVWVLPGGGIDPNELPEDAIMREILEESGLKTEVVRLVGEYTPVNRLARHTYLFEARTVGGSLSTGDETRSLGFFPLNSLPATFFHVHHDLLNDALEFSSLPIRKELSQVNYWEVLKFAVKHPLTVCRYLFTLAGYPLNK